MTSDVPGVAIIEVPVRLDAASAQAQQGSWQQAVAQADVIVDMAAAEFVDSTGVGVLIRLCKQAREVKRGFVLTCLQPTVETALKMMKLENFFSIEASVVAARIRILSERTASQVGLRAEQEVIVLSWRGDVTATTTPEICLSTLEELEALPDGVGAVVDLSNVDFLDSTGIGMMLKLKKELWQRNAKLIYRAPTDNVRNVLRVTKLESYLLDTNQ